MWKHSAPSSLRTQPQSIDTLSWYSRKVAIRPNSKWETSSASAKTSKEAQASSVLQRSRTFLCVAARRGVSQRSSRTAFSSTGMTVVKTRKMHCTRISHPSPGLPCVTPKPRPSTLKARACSDGSSISSVRTPDVVMRKDVTRDPAITSTSATIRAVVTLRRTPGEALSLSGARTSLSSAATVPFRNSASSRWSSEAACPRTSDSTVATMKANSAIMGTGSTWMPTSEDLLSQPIL
mmetsp:Transcript_52294/g.138135  ORF Transcript_52294/g.138135 Transcript_52294/m.138135 type:complete len:236 (+) Transcript_52294:450-1157(+)